MVYDIGMNIEKIIEDYGKELEEDTTLDELNVKEKSARAIIIRQRWIQRLNNTRWRLKQAEEEKEEILEEKLGNTNLPVNLSSKIKSSKMMETSPEIREINKKIMEYSHLVSYLEDTCKNMNQFGWDIKNFIELIKMENI